MPNDHKGDEEESAIDVKVDGLTMKITKPNNDDPTARDAHHDFSYDKAFAPHEGQEEIFAEVSEFVQSALDGYNVTLFSCTSPRPHRFALRHLLLIRIKFF